MAELKRGIEIERKYIIAMPDTSALAAMPGYGVSEIVQTYLASSDAVTHRVRARSSAGNTKYYETVKTRIDAMSAVEDEGEITRGEYEDLILKIAEGTAPVLKTRHIFRYGERMIEIDVYPEWRNTAILEVELPTRETVVELPEFIKVIREVTGIKRYSNAAMSRAFPPEDNV